jgi:hypothetical protein
MADALGHDASWIDQQMVSWRKIVDVHQIT